MYSNKKIFLHGNIECMQDELKPYINYTSKSLEHSQNVFANAKLLISAHSGMGEFALNCKLQNIILLCH